MLPQEDCKNFTFWDAIWWQVWSLHSTMENVPLLAISLVFIVSIKKMDTIRKNFCIMLVRPPPTWVTWLMKLCNIPHLVLIATCSEMTLLQTKVLQIVRKCKPYLKVSDREIIGTCFAPIRKYTDWIKLMKCHTRKNNREIYMLSHSLPCVKIVSD